MKKIYAVTLDDEVPLSDEELINFRVKPNKSDNVRAVAYWICDELSKYATPILCTDSEYETEPSHIIKNELNDNIVVNDHGYIYSFDSDKEIEKKRKFMYDPFIIDESTFGFTTYDGSLSETELAVTLESTLKLLGLHYKYSISSIVYDDKNLKNRYQAIKEIIKNKQIEAKPKVKTKSKVLPIITILGF